MIKRLLVGVGVTPFTDVSIQSAVEIANLNSATITGVTVVDSKRLGHVGPVQPGAGAYADRLSKIRLEVTEERVEAAVANFEEKCGPGGSPCAVERER